MAYVVESSRPLHPTSKIEGDSFREESLGMDESRRMKMMMS
ncbi:hypothetical protein LINGRAHAP2_LOCUS15147 [Linum grandiflorum]